MTPLASRMGTRASSSSEQSPERCLHGDNSLLLNDGNSELVHVEALKAAKEEHDRIRRAAQDAFNLHELRELTRKEEERIESERALAAEQRRLQALKATEVPKPPPPPPPKPPQSTPAPSSVFAPAPAPAAAQAHNTSQAQPQVPSGASFLQTKQTPANALPANVNGAAGNTQSAASTSTPPIAPFQPRPQAQIQAQPPQQAQPQSQPQPQPQIMASNGPDPHQKVHAALKLLRRGIMDQVEAAKKQRSPWGAKVGDLRRTLRKCIGQLTTEQDRNNKTVSLLQALLLLSFALLSLFFES